MRASKPAAPRKKKKATKGKKGERKDAADTFARPGVPRKKLLVPGGLPVRGAKPGRRRDESFSASPEIGEENENQRRGKRKRKASARLRQQHETDMILKATRRAGTYRSADFSDERTESEGEESAGDTSADGGSDGVVVAMKERGGGAPLVAAEEHDSVREVSAILADMEGPWDDDSDAEDLSDGEFDLIWKLHRVYGPHKRSLLNKVAREKESSTLTMAIVLRAAMNLHKSGAISNSQKVWLISKLSSDDPHPFLRSLPAATTDYQELEGLLLHLVPQQDQAQGKPVQPSRDEKEEKRREALAVALPSQLKVVKSKTGYDVNSLVNFKPVSMVPPITAAGVSPLSLVTRKFPVSGTSPAEPATEKVTFVCNISGKNCTNVRYHCTKIPDYDLSPESFEECKKENKFAPGMTETDFVRIDHCATDKASDPDHWTREETLLLLEGLEVFGENWAEVAEHVSTKSQLQVRRQHNQDTSLHSSLFLPRDRPIDRSKKC